MGILSRHSRKPPRWDASNYPGFEHQITQNRIKVALIHPKFTVRTRCPYCDEWCYRLRLKDGGEMLLVIVGVKYAHHQCPDPVEKQHQWEEQDDLESL